MLWLWAFLGMTLYVNTRYWKEKLGLDYQKTYILVGVNLILGALIGTSPAVFTYVVQFWTFLGLHGDWRLP